MKQVIVFPRGQLTSADRKRLADAELIAVEADDPTRIVEVIPGAPLITGDDLLYSLFEAMKTTHDSQQQFATALAKRILAREKEQC